MTSTTSEIAWLSDRPPAAAETIAHAAHRRIDEIEVLRGIAVLLVIVEHARINLISWRSPLLAHFYVYFGGWTGVDLFFAISGFVIARSLLPKLESATDPISFANATLAFWVRRAWRLLPSAWLWLMLILIAALVFNRSGVFGLFHANFISAIAAMLDVANFRIAQIYGLEFPGASFPYWSLSLEEQFYLLLPLVVFLSRKRLPGVLGILVLAQLFLTRTGPKQLLFDLRSDALLLGVLIALWSGRPSYRAFEPTWLARSGIGRRTLVIGLVGCLAILGTNGEAGFFDDQPRIISFRVGLIALLSAALVLIASFDRGYLWRDGITRRVMLWVGGRSYALYLVHIPAYFTTRELWYRIEPSGTEFGGHFTLRFVVTAVLLLLALAEANYRFIETPLRRRGAQIAERLERRTAVTDQEILADQEILG